MTFRSKLLSTVGVAGLALALSAAPAAAEIELGLGGHFAAYGVFADQDDSAGEPGADTADFNFIREMEIYFAGETTLDNGLTVGAEVQLEASSANLNANTNNNNDQIDEAYLYLSGNWGRVNLGSENGAAYLLQVGAPAVDNNFDGIDPEFIVFNGGVNAAAANVDYGMSIGGDNDRGDTDKITYLTPVFSGFQAGVSYAPDVCEDTTCTGNRNSAALGLPGDATPGDLENEFQIGGRWNGEFEGVGVTVGAGYATASQEVSTVANDDRDIFNVGLNVAFAGFTVGGAYYDDNNGVNSNGDTQTYTVGATYETGPYRVGVSYLDSETEVGAGLDDELSRFLVGGSYTYGPGMSFNGAVHFYDLEDSVSNPANENEATIVTLGTVVQF